MRTPKVVRYTVEIVVSQDLVDEGFRLDDARARRMLANHLPYAHGSQFDAAVIDGPVNDDEAGLVETLRDIWSGVQWAEEGQYLEIRRLCERALSKVHHE